MGFGSINKKPSIEFLQHTRCNACPLKKRYDQGKVRSWKIPPHGSLRPDIMVVGIGPGETEDAENRFFSGKSGAFLKEALVTLGINNVRFNNITKTRAPDNEPDQISIECCRNYLIEDIIKTKPKLILGLGGLVLHWFIGYDLNETVFSWKRRKILVRVTDPVTKDQHCCWFVLSTHPASITRLPPRAVLKHFPNNARTTSREEGTEEFYKDLQFAKDSINVPIDPDDLIEPDPHSFEVINGDFQRAIEAFNYFESVAYVAIDFETVRLRPYASDSKILCIGMSDGKRTAIVAMEHRESKWAPAQLKLLWRAFAKFWNSNSRKISHNLAFEFEWAIKKCGRLRRDHLEDSQAQSYILDHRIEKLDFLCMVFFGIRIKTLSSIHIENLDNDPLEDVCIYNGYDVWYELKLFLKQQDAIRQEGLDHIYREQVRRIPTFIYAQAKGLIPDLNQVAVLDAKFSQMATTTLHAIYNNSDFQRGVTKIPRLVPTSPTAMTKFFNWLGYEIENSDETILQTIDHPVAQLVLDLRVVNKLKSTYIDIFKPGPKSVVWPDHLVHTQFKLLFTVTGRSSSEFPNVQNFPKHGHSELRSIIIAPPGYDFVSSDYGQMEFRCAGIESGDPELIRYIKDKTQDIHTDWAKKILNLYPEAIKSVPQEELDKAKGNMIEAYRQTAKNGFVFAKIYGAGSQKTSETLKIPLEISQKLDRLFREQFAGLIQWQNELFKSAVQKGYVENKLGRRRKWFKKKTQIINDPIQGLASDIVIDAMNRLSIYAEETGQEQFQPIINIHDDISHYIPKDSLTRDIDIIGTMMVNCPYEFINVPLKVEVASGPNWYDLKEVKSFES